jgi:potassium-transporting ATPase potassium-binding subunit
MIESAGIELLIIGLLILAIVPLLGTYMAYVFSDTRPNIRFLSWIEEYIYRFSGIHPTLEMNWKMYCKALFLFNGLGFFFVWILQLTQQWLPFNPQNFSAVEPFLALNTAISFATNTNWQNYYPEISLSYLTQFLGLTVQNFTSAATGNAVLLALIRGFNRSNGLLGNFWVDVTRTIVYLLLPLSIILSIVLVSQGSIQNFNPYQEAEQWEQGTQVIPMGPVASQVAIKQWGSNGGGFFNSNSAHPFENPTSFSNILELLAIFAIPIASVYMFGILIHSKSQGYVILGVMSFFFLVALGTAMYYEWQPNPLLEYSPVLEGKEQRLGVTNSAIWAVATSAVSHGSISSAMDSLSPLAGGVSLLLMMTGGIVFGGMGTGLTAMLLHVLLTVFLAGLMVGRSPEYLGKKIEKTEIQWTIFAILIPCALILLGSSIALTMSSPVESLKNGGPHGFTEMLYAFASNSVNNGSAFEGLQGNTLFFNLILGFCMLIARVSIIASTLAVAGSLSQKSMIALSAGTLKTNTLLFGGLIAFLLFIITTLTFFPAFALGPVVEHILMHQGQTF